MTYSFKLPILLAIVCWLVGCDGKPDIVPSGQTIKVGIIAPFSGSDLAKGKDGLKGIKTAARLQPYLRNGDGIELVVEDDQDKPSLALEALKKLTQEEKVSAVITFSSSGPVLALAGVADAYQTPILAVLATHPDTTEGNNFVSQLCFDDIFQGMVAALFVRDELMLEKVALFSNPYSNHSSNLAAQFERKFTSLGGEITDTILLSDKTEGLASILNDVRTNKPELLYLPIKATDVLRLIKETEKLAWEPEMMASDGLFSTVLTQYKDELNLLEGMLGTDFFDSYMRLTPYGELATARHDGRMSSYAALGVEAYAVLLNAMNRCENTMDKNCINDMIRSTTNLMGVMGKITIGADGKAQRPLVVNSIKNNQVKFIVKVY